MPIMEKALVRMENIHKWFGKVHALKGVNIEIWPGEIVGLVGDNGAGKSTLIKILAGVMRKDKGEIYWNEKKVDIPSVDDSRKLGIETLFQEQSIIGRFLSLIIRLGWVFFGSLLQLLISIPLVLILIAWLLLPFACLVQIIRAFL